MLNVKQIKRLAPALTFLLTYTLLFWLFCATFQFTFPFLAGFGLALLIQPLVRLLAGRCKLKSGAASLLSTVLIFLLLFGLLVWAGVGLISELRSLIDYLSQLDMSKYREPLLRLMDEINAYIEKIDVHYIGQHKEQLWTLASGGISLLTRLLSGLLGFLTSLPAIFTMILVMIFSTYYFAKDMPSIKRGLMAQFTDSAALRLSDAAGHGVAMMGRYLSSYLIIYLITFLESLVIFSVLELPYPLVLSIITGIADIIPILGPGAVYFPLAIGALIRGNIFTASALVIAWLVITLVREIIEPKIVSSSIEIHPLCMLAALYFALVSGSFLTLLYFTLLFVFYQILKKVDILPPIFQKSPAPSAPKNAALLGRWKRLLARLKKKPETQTEISEQ